MKLIKKSFHVLFSTVDRRVGYYIKLIKFCKERNFETFGIIFSRRLQRKYGVFLPYAASFDSSLILRHPVGIVIGEKASIGKDVIIFQNVTLGRSETHVDAYPKIGNNTIIYAGAVILGNVEVGENCIIGANAVVTKNVPDNSVAVGVPARNFTRQNYGRREQKE